MGATSYAVVKTMVVVVAFLGRMNEAATLGKYGADPNQVSVSGVSSGANMAVQLHVAFSSSIMGAGVVAGGPYACAEVNSITDCTTGNPSNINIAALKTKTEQYASAGKVDATSNLASDRVYIFSGTGDITVKTGVVEKLEDYYEEYISSSNIKTVYNVAAGHGFITENYGALCALSVWPFINDCDYNQAYDILNHIYGNLQQPTGSTTLNGQLLSFSQTEFFGSYNFWTRPMAYTGYVYVPSGCASTTNCRLHVALHGCSQTTAIAYSGVYDRFYTETGYNEVGELNDIIILYPQALINPYLVNPLGCWDWWGYKDSDFATNTGWEVEAIKGMIDRILESP